MSEIKKVLIVRFGSLGDVLLTTPLLRALKTDQPDVAVDYFTKPAAAQLLHGNPHINRIHELEGAGFMALADQAGRMGDEHYDLIVDFHRNLRSWYVNRTVASKKYVKMQRDRFRRWLLVRWSIDRYGDNIDPVPVRYFGALDGVFGSPVKPDDKGLEIFLTDEDRREADEIINSDDPLLSIAPCAKWPTKRWLPERFAELADELAEKLGAIPLLLGDSEDVEVADEIMSQMKTRAINLAGKLSIRGTAAAIDRSMLFIGNDTALMHVASALDTPGVAIFGPTTRHLGFYPYKSKLAVAENNEIPCRPCTKQGDLQCPAGHFRCMARIPVDRVLDVALKCVEK